MHEYEDIKPKTYKTVLSIAGSDSIGGAGVQADVKTCMAHGVYAMTVITAVTAQNTSGVMCYEAMSEKLVQAQLQAALADVRPDAVKIGMLPNAEIVKIVAGFIKYYNLKNVVLDPVCVSTSGHALANNTVPSAMAKYLFPLVTVVTPNLPEAETFAAGIYTDSEVEKLGEKLMQEYQLNAMLLKGGHLSGNECVDRLYFKNNVYKFSHKRIYTVNTHGTGCSLSSAIASNLALEFDVASAVEKASNWIAEAIEAGSQYKFGHGHGPINHMYNIIR